MYTSIRHIELNKSKRLLIKHIYVGSERIVSKVSANNPDYDPRQENCAGNSLTGYTVKLQSQQQALSDSIASIYAKLEVPYYPNNNDDYDYNWSDGVRRSVTNPDSYGEFAYFYHSDYLGSTSYVTDATGAVSQHVEYVPFGEVFIEELSSSAKLNTPYLFNGKELDEETGLYYYGARYYDPRISLWLSTDPMELKYPNISSYAYCANNPIKLIDPQGTEAVYNLNGDYLGSTKEGFTGDILIHIGDYDYPVNSHRLAYKNVINYKPLWNKTTDDYKAFNLQMLLEYTTKETGRNIVDKPYRRLYNKYCK